MRKFYLLFAALFAYTVVATAGVKNLFKQDFESVSDPAAIGWSSPNLPGGMSILSDEYGSFFQFSLGSNNGRSCNMLWKDNVNYEGITKYDVCFSWSLAQNANNQYSSEICVFTDESSQVNNGWMSNSEKAHWLFTLTQADTETFYVNNNTEDTFVPVVGSWYNFIVSVDTEARTASYQILNSLTQAVEKEGVYNVPEEWPMFANGFNILASRYYSIHQLDDIIIKSNVEGDYANDPSVAMTAVNMKERTYTIAFDPDNDEVLHVKGTDGKEETATESPYTYTTSTSGTLEAWTVSGTAESNHIKTEVVCEEIALPAAEAALVAVDAGFAKTYKVSVSNAEVPTQPQLFINVEYTGENGESQSYQEQMSGFQISVKEKGVLKLTTIAYGFASTTVSIQNDAEFETKDVIDFQHMTADDLTAKGFAKKDDLNATNMSGENNWTARLRMYFQIATGEKDADGNDICTNYAVYGFTDADALASVITPGQKTDGREYGDFTSIVEPIQRFQFKQSELTEEVARSMFAPLYLWWYGLESVMKGVDAPDANGVVGGCPNPKINLGIGLVQSGVVGDDETYDPGNKGYGNILVNTCPLGVDGLTDDDFIIAYTATNYGGESVHPIFPAGTSLEDAKAQYKAMNLGGVIKVMKGTETFTFNRVDEAVVCVKTFKAKNGTGIETLPYNKVISDHNAPIYNLNGVQMNPNTLKKGVYVKQGKKFVIK
jgi:hypothetical protein